MVRLSPPAAFLNFLCVKWFWFGLLLWIRRANSQFTCGNPLQVRLHLKEAILVVPLSCVSSRKDGCHFWYFFLLLESICLFDLWLLSAVSEAGSTERVAPKRKMPSPSQSSNGHSSAETSPCPVKKKKKPGAVSSSKDQVPVSSQLRIFFFYK